MSIDSYTYQDRKLKYGVQVFLNNRYQINIMENNDFKGSDKKKLVDFLEGQVYKIVKQRTDESM